MPHPIRYTTGSDSRSVKKGNFYISMNDIDKGPSNSTGYYSGITPPAGGYTIYQNRPTGDFSIYVASNDTELITITNRIAQATYSTVQECLNYFSSQSDKMVLNRDLENITTNGLVLYYDASSISSYPKSGTTINDISGNGYDGTLTNGPTFSTANSGSISLDGTNDFISIPGNTTVYSSNFTWQSFHYTRQANVSDLDAMWWSESGVKNFLMGYRNTGIPNVYFRIDSPSTVYQSPSVGTQTNGFGTNAGSIVGRWLYTTIVKSGTTFYVYWNDGLLMWTVTISDWSIGNTSQAISFGSRSGNAFNSFMDIGNIIMYNRALSVSEIQQNFNAQRLKFGL